MNGMSLSPVELIISDSTLHLLVYLCNKPKFRYEHICDNSKHLGGLYYISQTVFKHFADLTCFSQQPYVVGIIIVSILQMRKLRQKVVP